MTANGASSPHNPKNPSHSVWRRLGQIFGIGLGVFCGLSFLALIALRLYFTDDRLRDLGVEYVSQRLQTSVQLQGLDMSLFRGLELTGLRVDAPEGFSEPLLDIGRIAIQWSAWDLLRLHVTINEVALQDVDLTIEEHPGRGRNFEVLLLAWQGTETAAPEPTESPTEKPVESTAPSITQPSFPVTVEVRRLVLGISQIRVLQPDRSISIDQIGAEGGFFGSGDEMELRFHFGLGQRRTGGPPSRLQIRDEMLGGELTVEENLDLDLRAHNITELGLDLDWDATVTTQLEQPIPPIGITADLGVTADLISQTVNLARFQWTVGDAIRFDLAASAKDLLSQPTLHLAALDAEIDLTSLAPWIAILVPETDISGRVAVRAEPMDSRLSTAHWSDTAAQLTVLLQALSVSMPTLHVVGLDSTLVAEMAENTATLSLTSSLNRAAIAGQTLHHLDLTGQITTPLLPWLDPTVPGQLSGEWELALPAAGGAAGHARDTRVRIGIVAPVALLRGQATTDPLSARVGLSVGDLQSPQATAHRIRLDTTAELWDLKGETARADLSASIDRAQMGRDDDTMAIDDVRLTLAAKRSGPSISLEQLTLAVADAVRFGLSGRVDSFQSTTPRFHRFAGFLEMPDLARTLALAPETRRPEIELSGSARLNLWIDGAVPYRDLLADSRLPQPNASKTEADLTERVQQYVAFLSQWRATLEKGLPFTAGVDAHLTNIHFADAQQRVSGFNLDWELSLERQGPQVEMAMVADDIEGPIAAHGLRTDLRFSFEPGQFRIAVSGLADQVRHPTLATPLRETTADLVLSYRLGGDLLLEQLSFDAPQPGFSFSASGVVSKPLQLALTQGWKRPHLPGLAMVLRWKGGLSLGDELRALQVGGPVLSGGAAVSGSLRAEDGLLSLDGTLTLSHLNLSQKDLVVEDMSGSLPIELKLGFDPREDATIVRDNVPLGSGVVALLTSSQDVRKRPARPAYYDRLRPYRQRAGLTARSLRKGPMEIYDFSLEGRVTQGMLLVDWLAMEMLGGDINGNLALQIGRDASLRTDLAFRVSNIDASYFEALGLQPGPQSELSADLQLAFLAAPSNRDLTLYMNVTKIGSDTFDRFLRLLDPEGKNEPIQFARSRLWMVRIDEVKTWIRYENLNMDLAVTTFIRIPGTNIGYPNIERELLRRYSLADMLDAHAQPKIDQFVAPLLGWKNGN